MKSSPQQKLEIDGILLLDKPIGISSNSALQQVKRCFSAKKAGHTGSLDPLATGLLPICFGNATKFSQYLLDADKTYVVVAEFGKTTTTGDAEGEVISQSEVPDDLVQQVEQLLPKYQGTISQTPSMYSALKHQGQPLYKLARQGIEIERPVRQVVIHELSLESHGESWVEMKVRCSKGTYIRSLVEDMGSALGCGGYVRSLRRIGAGPYQASQMVTLEQLQATSEGSARPIDGLRRYLLPVDTAISHWEMVQLTDNAAYYFCMGQAVFSPQAPRSGWVRLFSEQRGFLGIGQITDEGKIAPKRLVV